MKTIATEWIDMKKTTDEKTSATQERKSGYLPKPEWLKVKLPRGFKAGMVAGMLHERGLHTICTSGLCPNRGECWGNGTATFMIGGEICTRNCKFCNVTTGRPKPLDTKEIDEIVDSIKDLKLRHVVLTSVDRDDLEDYGTEHWVRMIRSIKEQCPGVTMETLIPDLWGDEKLLDRIVEAGPEVISHNMETVRRLTPEVRSVATYDRSLGVIRYLSGRGVRTKSGIMLGLGETPEEIEQTMDDLRDAGCQIMTIGQYLQPTRRHYQLREYIAPEVFEEYRKMGLAKGFMYVESSPLVRSSYHAERHVH